MRIEDSFDFLNPDYVSIFKARIERLERIRANPQLLANLKVYYKDNPGQFITDWGCTFDPRNASKRLPSLIPFILMPKQQEWVDWFMDHWRNDRNMLVEKTRTVGMSWLSTSLACTLCLFNPGVVFGFGSRKEDYVDKIGKIDALFPKMRLFLKYIPVEFLDGFDLKKDAPFMLISFSNGSQIVGESGDGIGRGGRTSAYITDEEAFIERSEQMEASLSENTNCRVSISTPNGLANSFAQKRFSGKIDVFTFHWRDDLRRNQAWYDKKVAELDPVIIAQEYDINYSASIEGVVIPSEWIQASVDAHIKLNLQSTGAKLGAWDVADEGSDDNAFIVRHGIVLLHAEAWKGLNGDIFHSTQKVFNLCDRFGIKQFVYDADGLGAGARGDARVINQDRETLITVSSFRGSGAVDKPEAELVKGRKNKDYFTNAKAQSWWALRLRFQATYRAVIERQEYNADDLISISSQCPNYLAIISELCQPTYTINNVGKILVDKKPDGVKSPNLADAVMMSFANLQNREFNVNLNALNSMRPYKRPIERSQIER